MGSGDLKQAPLVVDADSAYVEGLRKEATELKKAPPFIASDVNQAYEIVQMHKQSIGMLIISTRLGRDTVMSFVSGVLKTIPGLPVILLSDWEATEFSEEEMRRMVVQMVLVKPVRYTDIVKKLLTPQAELNKSKSKTDQDFAPIQIDALTAAASQPATEDVYVKLRSNRYIKILKAGYVIGTERVERYVKRGVKSFYKAK